LEEHIHEFDSVFEMNFIAMRLPNYRILFEKG